MQMTVFLGKDWVSVSAPNILFRIISDISTRHILGATLSFAWQIADRSVAQQGEHQFGILLLELLKQFATL